MPSMDPATITALVGLGLTALGIGGAGVTALWRIAGGLGQFRATTTTILGAMQVMLQDHEERIRMIERRH